jgi:GT2 family glycosyltransferase
MIPVLAIPVLNRYDLLDIALESIDFPIKEVLIINNGKEKYKPKRTDINIRVLDLPSNLGMSGSWNLTIKLYPHEKFWIFSSADIVFTEGSLQSVYEQSGSSNMVCSIEGFSCFSLGENFIKEVGLFDEYIYPYSFEDDDYRERCLIAQETNKNLKMYFNTFKVKCPTGEAQTVKSDEKIFEEYQKTHKKNKEYYELKKSQQFKTMGSWNINRRRDQEWLP